MNILVTATYPPTLWEIKNDKTFKLEFKDFTSISLIAENYTQIPPLPTDLATKILSYLLLIYLEERDYHLALSCCRIDKYHLKYFYNRIYRPSNSSPLEQFTRLSKTFLFCEAIDDYLCAPCYEYQSVALRLSRPGFEIDQRPLRPWQFGAYSITEEIPPNFTVGFEHIHPIHVGDNVCDTIWLQGVFHNNGIFKATHVLHPVINIILCDTSDTILPINKDLIRNFYFIKFIELLKLIYGPRMVINFMVKDDSNPFLVLSESFINFY